MPEINLSREELYNLIWAEPVSRLAKRYGLSDYQFRQLCTRLSIPMPRQGHWNKQRAGERWGRRHFPELQGRLYRPAISAGKIKERVSC